MKQNLRGQKNSSFFIGSKILGKAAFLAFAFILTASNLFAANYPMGPDDRLTVGSLCERGNTFRYDEHIQYCNRSVSAELKWDIIDQYESLGYGIREFGRNNFKIDHFIPLCAGGSNNVDNLWPQHKDVYEKTDRIEQLVCQLMSEGKLSQAEAVRFVKEAKLHLDSAAGVESDLKEKLDPTPKR